MWVLSLPATIIYHYSLTRAYIHRDHDLNLRVHEKELETYLGPVKAWSFLRPLNSLAGLTS